MGVNKPSRPDLAPIRCKEMFRLEELSQVLAKPRYCALLVLYNIVSSMISSLVPYPYYPLSLDSYLFSSVHPQTAPSSDEGGINGAAGVGGAGGGIREGYPLHHTHRSPFSQDHSRLVHLAS